MIDADLQLFSKTALLNNSNDNGNVGTTGRFFTVSWFCQSQVCLRDHTVLSATRTLRNIVKDSDPITSQSATAVTLYILPACLCGTEGLVTPPAAGVDCGASRFRGGDRNHMATQTPSKLAPLRCHGLGLPEYMLKPQGVWTSLSSFFRKLLV